MTGNRIYRVASDDEFNHVMVNDIVAQHAYNTAKCHGMDEIGCLRQAIVALSVAKSNIFNRQVSDAGVEREWKN